MQETYETWVWSLGREHPLEEGMATHSSILAWRIPRTEEHRELQSMGLQRVKTWLNDQHTHTTSAAARTLPGRLPALGKYFLNEWPVSTQISRGIRVASMNHIKSLRCSELDWFKYACLRKGREGQRQKVKFYSGDCCITLLSILASPHPLCFLSLSGSSLGESQTHSSQWQVKKTMAFPAPMRTEHAMQSSCKIYKV